MKSVNETNNMSTNKIANQTDEVVEDLLKEEVDPELFQKVDE